MSRFDAFAFDAYGTLFDVYSISALAERLVPGQGLALTQLWRTKQLEYSWLSSLMISATYPRPDFDAVTRQALDYALAALVIPLDRAAREKLIGAYLELDAFADAAATLERLAPTPRVILSNGTQAMLRPLLEHSGLASQLDDIVSVDDAGIFKPSPRVYQLLVDRFNTPAQRIAFVSSNGWDAAGAKAFGFTTFWINRAGLPMERHAPDPDFVIGSLAQIPELAKS
ncbi:MAG TPA: haloacid dehalogenase type II [Casimicrobiaceae bacterium]|nr:haloacid dehalogenase type II [Casimicrobiaceae bacterium]